MAAVAAQDLQANVVTDLDEVTSLWPGAATVFVADDHAERVASRALRRREGVFVVGASQERLAVWSAPLGARVIPLPGGVAWLGAVLDEGASRAGAPVVAVLGGSGGVGASTLAAGLALAGAGRREESSGAGRREESRGAAALVDVDALGGGVDLLMGAERADGWRWPKLWAAEGYVGDLREYLPCVDGVSVLSMARETGANLAGEPLIAIVQSLRRSHRLVVIDVGRSLTPAAREAVRLASCQYLVVAPDVRGIAAADQVLRAYHPDRPEVVVRRGRGQGGVASTIRDLLGCDVVAWLPKAPGLASSADRGDPPGRSAGRAYERVCRALVKRVGER